MGAMPNGYDERMPDDDLNPYAPPRVPEPMERSPAGVGVWREGDLVVMHERSPLPLYCVKTGMPTKRTAAMEIDRLELSSPRLRLVVPLASPWHRIAVSLRTHALFVGLATVFGGLLVALAFRDAFGADLRMPATLIAGVLFFGLTGLGLAFGEPLDCVRSEGSYLWLRGASREFLQRLPLWDER